ncbi:MAG: hypothetical protein AB8F78_14625 [Saprospiraceae bacterium]
MSVSILSSILLACGLGLTATNPDLPTNPINPANPTTHTLAIKVHEGGNLIIDGVSVGDTVLQLSNAHVATLAEEGSTLYTVMQPNGEVFYKGDFSLAVQSVSSGTMKIYLQDGEAILMHAEAVEE